MKKEFIFYVIMLSALFFVCLMGNKTTKELSKQIDELVNEKALLANEISKLKEENDNLQNDLILKKINYEAISNQNQILINSNTEQVYYLSNLIEPIKYIDKETYYDLYKGINSLYADNSETIYECLDEEEIKYIQKCVETETYDCPFEAKVNVACVILNRIEHEKFPNDGKEVVTSKNQFAYGRNNITDSTVKAVEYAFEIGSEEVKDCIGFRSDICPNIWNGWEYVYTDGKHYFYKLKEN